MKTKMVCLPAVLGTLLFTYDSARSQSQPASPSAAAVTTKPAGAMPHDFEKWEADIAAFERADRDHPPSKGGVLFIGSSTIRMWETLEKDFPKHRVINRGFGGSQIADATHFAERIIFPYEPKVIVLRAGGNDIHAGKSPEQVFADFKAFVVKVHAKLPKTQIVMISQTPTIARWAERDANKALNELIEPYIRQKPFLKYVETYDMVLTSKGQPRPELFVADKQHFNNTGYKLLAERVAPFLPK